MEGCLSLPQCLLIISRMLWLKKPEAYVVTVVVCRPAYAMLSIASKEQIRLDDEEMMMTSVDEAKMMTDDDDEKTTMTNEEDDAEIKMRHELDMVAQPCKRTRHGAKNLGCEICDPLQADAINWDADKSESNSQREKDHAAIAAEEQVYSKSVDTLERAT